MRHARRRRHERIIVMGKHDHTLPKPRTEADMARFVKAMQRADPTLNSFRLTAEGDLIAERRDAPQIAPASYDTLDFTKK